MTDEKLKWGERNKLPTRRQGVNLDMVYKKGKPGEIKFSATLNWREGGRITEAFCLAAKEGSDLQVLLHHTCIIASVALQYGATMDDLAHALAENDAERPSRSIMGLIIRAGVRVDTERGFPPKPREPIEASA